MKRKLLSLLLILAMVLAVFPASALAAGSNKSMVWSQDGLQFEKLDDGSVQVKGFDSTANPDMDVTIPETVTKDEKEYAVTGISKEAFKNTDITSVYISEGVTDIGDSAFEGCEQLSDVTFGGAYADLGIDCFKNCTSLEVMYVPVVGVIPSGTFAGCTNLGYVELEDGNMIIKEGAFAGCTSLEYIRLPASIQQIYTKDFEEMEAILVKGEAGTEKELSIAQKFANKMAFLFEAEDSDSDEETWFTDVNRGNYYTVPVLWGSMTGVVAGYGNGKFGTNDNCTRADMVTFLWRLNGCPTPKAEKKDYHKFCDVPSNEYYTDAVQWAYEMKITAGTGTNKEGKDFFSPNATVTREQVISFLWRMNDRPKTAATTTPFQDVNTKGYYYEALLWASENKVVAGTEADQFSPEEPCTRAQIITFMYRNLHYWYLSDDADGKFI